MTLDDKSQAIPAPPRSGTEISDRDEFSDVVDVACEKLKERQIKYSVERIHKMREILDCLEKELDDFLLRKDGDIK